jgi:serine/threonine protein kinase
VNYVDVRAFYLLHCLADQDFYESLDRRDDTESRFPHCSAVLPAGWTRFVEGLWIVHHPPGVHLPEQGWKVHVSAGPDTAGDVLNVVWEFCVQHEIAFKFLRSRDVVLLLNSKYADRASSGKFCTIYPIGDEALERTTADLGHALVGQPGPYILSDVRWRDGPVYLRYGAFTGRYCLDETGDRVLAVAAPDGRLVPDVRRPGGYKPAWAPVPGFLAERVTAANRERPPEFPYRIEHPLHFSNGGGVYLAVDTRTGGGVVLKEARPGAGLDANGDDAVARLAREHRTLRQLSDVDVVPAPLDYFTCWEHHFLVEEYLEGEGLRTCLSERYPELGLDERDGAGYVAWALEISGKVAAALAAMHERGVVFGDCHPGNIIVRPDGRVAFVDFELAFPVTENRRLGLGAPGFAAPEGCSGFDIDRYALACVRLWLFLTFAPTVHARDPGKVDLFVRIIRDRFAVPESFARHLRDDLCLGRPPTTPDPACPEWTDELPAVAEAIVASATPNRDDRLFPGDVYQFRYGGLGLAYGAAGVLYALAATGHSPRPEHVDWLVRAARRARQPSAGLYQGLPGVAQVLDLLGRHEEALNVLDRALDIEVRGIGLFGGLAGAGLNLLDFARDGAHPALREHALRIAERLGQLVRDGESTPDRPRAAGLMYGFSGAALLFLRLHRDTGDHALLELAVTALRRDLDYCRDGGRNSLQVLEQERLMPYLAVGSAGITVALGQYLQVSPDEELSAVQRRLLAACDTEFVLFPGLFTGRAGLMAALAVEHERTGDQRLLGAARAHLSRLSWHAVRHRGRPVFPGDQCLRLSMDLATGTAGVLLAAHAVRAGSVPALPLLGPWVSGPPRRPAVAR